MTGSCHIKIFYQSLYVVMSARGGACRYIVTYQDFSVINLFLLLIRFFKYCRYQVHTCYQNTHTFVTNKQTNNMGIPCTKPPRTLHGHCNVWL